MTERKPGPNSDSTHLLDLTQFLQENDWPVPEYADLITDAIIIAGQELRHPYVGTLHMTLALLRSDPQICEKLGQAQITERTLRMKAKENLGRGTRQPNVAFITQGLAGAIQEACEKDDQSDLQTVRMNLLRAILGQRSNDTLLLISALKRPETASIDVPPGASTPLSLKEIRRRTTGPDNSQI